MINLLQIIIMILITVFASLYTNKETKIKVIDTITHCESIVEDMPYSSIEECVKELTR